MTLRTKFLVLLGGIALLVALVFAPLGRAQAAEAATPIPAAEAPKDVGGPGNAEARDATFSQEEILEKARGFFGEVSQGLAKAIAKVFEEQGRPNAFIEGEEVSGAFVVGARYGKGRLVRKFAPSRELFWQGPSVGFDVGGEASRVFTLVYSLDHGDQLYKRFPGVDGSFYFVAGASASYLRSGDIVIAPVRTGVGLRAGANVGYMHFTPEHSWIPL